MLPLAEAANHPFDAARVVELGNIERPLLVWGRDAAGLAGVDEALELGEVLGGLLDRRRAEIAADAYVIDAAHLDRMVDLAHQHVDRRRTGARADEWHEVDPNHAALVGHGL